MPELPECRIITDQLSAKLKEQSLNSISIVGGRFLKEPIPNLDKLKFPIVNARFDAYGKFLYWSFDNEIFFFITLGMTGGFGSLSKHSAIKFEFEKDVIYFNDIRRFGTFKVVLDKKELDKKLDSLGWEPFINPNNIPEKFWSRLEKKKDKTIAEVLLDQTLFSGLGNYLKCDILYLAKIHPNRLLSSISQKEVHLLINLYKELALESYKYGGNTIATFRHIDGSKGAYVDHLKVYGKKYDHLGNKVSRIKTKDGRTTYFVEKIQI